MHLLGAFCLLVNIYGTEHVGLTQSTISMLLLGRNMSAGAPRWSMALGICIWGFWIHIEILDNTDNNRFLLV